MIKYQYQILRYMHDQFTGEFGNLGVVLYAPERQFLQCKVITRYGRLADFFGEVNGQFLVNSIRAIEIALNKRGQELQDGAEPVQDLAEITSQLLPPDDSALQFTFVQYGIDIEGQAALDGLFGRIIEKYNAEGHSTPHTDYYAWKTYYKEYFDRYGITRKLQKHTVSTDKDKISFDKAWKNGVWNFYQPLSFDLKSEDAIKGKVYKWSGIIKELESSDEKLHLYFLTTTPTDHIDLVNFISETLTTTEPNLVVDVVSEDNAELFVADVRRKMEESNVIDPADDDVPF